jgi:hypothetical protein
MTHTFQYNNTTIKHVYDQLLNFKNQGTTKDYEIRIDDLTVIQRTKNMGNFHLFKKSLTDFSEAISFLLYKGNSRKCDKYILTRKSDQKSVSTLATEEYLEQRLQDWINEEKREVDLARLKEENKHLKKQLRKSDARNTNLEAKKSGDLKEIIELITTSLPSLTGGKVEIPTELNGIKMTDLMGMVNSCRTRWGDETFGRVLGITMTIGDDLELLKTVENLLETKKGEEDGN